MKEFLKSGSWIHFPDSGYSNEINLSAYTANQLKLKTGDKLFTYFIQPDGSKRVRPMVVAGIFKTGIENFDRVNALVDIRLIQRLNNWNAKEIGGYEIFIQDNTMADSVSNRIFEKLPQKWNSRSIKEIYGNIFDWLNLMNNSIVIVIVIMVLVAILNLVTCLIILLLERTHMVGLLKSMGRGRQWYPEDISLSRRPDYLWWHPAGKSARSADILASRSFWNYYFAGRNLFYCNGRSGD